MSNLAFIKRKPRPIGRIEFVQTRLSRIEKDLRICRAILEIDCDDIAVLKEYNRLISDLDKTMLKLFKLVNVDMNRSIK